jgi:hypothetical protein
MIMIGEYLEGGRKELEIPAKLTAKHFGQNSM